jgi:hypothetical protein
MLGHQPAGQLVRHFASPLFPFGEGHQTILPIGAKHLLKGRPGQRQELGSLAIQGLGRHL